MKKNKIIIGIILLVLLLAFSFFLFNKPLPPSQEELASRKTVEDYFIEHMSVSAEEAKTMASDGVMLRLSPDSTLQGVVGNLYYYGFIDDEAKFGKLLKTSINLNSNYYLNYSMSDEEIADTLLNKAQFEPNFTRYNYLFMPSGKNSEN